MADWETKLGRTWVSWPTFDLQDHALCPVLDAFNQDAHALLSELDFPFFMTQPSESKVAAIRSWRFMEFLKDTDIDDLTSISAWHLRPPS